jgi:membrane protein DedA with SNARE-associated domain
MTDETHFIFAQVVRATIGLSSTVFAAIMPWQEHIQWGMAILASAIGILVGVASLYSIVRAWKLKKEEIDP